MCSAGKGGRKAGIALGQSLETETETEVKIAIEGTAAEPGSYIQPYGRKKRWARKVW